METGECRRRRYSYYQKKELINEHLEKGLSISAIARKYQIHPVTLFNWKRMFKMAEENPLPTPDVNALIVEVEELRKQNKQLKKALADTALDKSVLGDALKVMKKRHLEFQLSKLRKASSSSKNTPEPESVEL